MLNTLCTSNICYKTIKEISQSEQYPYVIPLGLLQIS